MTWKELKEKAKEMGYVEEDKYGTRYLRLNELCFGEQGCVYRNTPFVPDILAKGRTKEQMLMIMRGLE